MRPEGGADAVDGVLVIPRIRFESGIDRLLQRFEPEADRNDLRAENLHAGHVRRLLGDIDFPHMDFTFEPEIGRRRRKRDAVLPGPGLGDKPLLAHDLRQQPLAHTVIELVGSGVVQVLAFEVDLTVADLARQPVTMVDRRRPPLKLAPDPAQLVDEVSRPRDRLVGRIDLPERLFEFGGQITAAVGTEAAVRRRVIAKIT